MFGSVFLVFMGGGGVSHFGHFRALETPGGDLVDLSGASFWGPGGSSGRPLGDFGSTSCSCEGVEVI